MAGRWNSDRSDSGIYHLCLLLHMEMESVIKFSGEVYRYFRSPKTDLPTVLAHTQTAVDTL